MLFSQEPLTKTTGGLHNVTVYVRDEFENAGTSQTITFSVEEPYPTTLFIVAAAAIAATGGAALARARLICKR